MAKIVLSDVTSGSSVTINRNFQKIEDALNDEVLFRDNPEGEPNQMESDLDMNSNDILNAGVIKAKRVIADSIDNNTESLIDGGVSDNEIVKWDVDTSKFVGTGVFSNSEGELDVSSNSVSVGVHKIGSMGENVGFFNKATGKSYFPSWQGVGISDSDTFTAVTRVHGPLEYVVRTTNVSEVLINPEFIVTVPYSETVFKIGLYCTNEVHNVHFRLTYNNSIVFDGDMGSSQSVGMTTFTLPTPVDLRQGAVLVAKAYGIGQDLYVKGGSDGVPAYSLWMRPWVDKELATVEYVDGKPQGKDTFVELLDCPNTYVGQGKKLVAVNESESALEFIPHTLESLDNVLIVSPIQTDGEVLMYNLSENRWENQALPEFQEDILRISYTTPNSLPAKQLLNTSNVGSVITFNVTEIASDFVQTDLTSGVLTFVDSAKAMFTMSVQVIRETGGAGDALWGMYVETSMDGVSWSPVSGTTRLLLLTGGDSGDVKLIDYTVPISVVAGEKVRFKQYTSDSSKQIGIISSPQTIAGIPTNAGVTLGVYRVQH
ncbi:hypothetical protein [Vibrio phage MJW]